MWQSAYLDLISKKKQGIFAAMLRAILWLLSIPFAFIVWMRSKFLRPKYKPRAKTISIGNIVAGGTGKTPFAIYLAAKLGPCALLLRGYKAKIEKEAVSLVVTKETEDVALIGDEAMLIFRRVPQAKVIVGRNKCQSAQIADSLRLPYILIDDGMQHMHLARDVEIVLLDSQNPFGYGYLLPRGLLREPPSSLSRADLVVITSRSGEDDVVSVEQEIRRYTSAPICTMTYEPYGLYDLQDRPVELASNTKVTAFCAIAKPEQFLKTLSSLGLVVERFVSFPDHDMVPLDELKKLAKSGSYLICTEKDRVKFSPKEAAELPLLWLKVEVKITAGEEKLFALIKDALQAET